MSINQVIPLKKPYLFTSILLLVAGIVLTVALTISKGSEFLLMGVVGTLIATGICSVVNLIYFIPSESLFNRLIAPGIATVLLTFFLMNSSPVDLLFFMYFAVSNLLLGIFWYRSINKIKKEQGQNL